MEYHVSFFAWRRRRRSIGRKAPSPCNTPIGSKLFDVHGRSQANPVARTGVGAHHFEKLAPVVLFGLIGRKPLAQKILTSLFAMKMRTLFRHIDPRPAGMRKATLARRIGETQHHPPLRRGMNSVSSAAGSNFETILLWPGPVRSAAVKP